MYEAFYGFREPPFRVTPDPRFLYRNPAIDEAVAALTYGIERRKGFLSLVGEVGHRARPPCSGTCSTRSPPTTQTVFILYPTVQFEEMLEHILHELGIPTDGAGKFTKLQRLHEFLLEHTRGGGNAAILIDEAQDLDARVLEELRLLSNLETGTEKILQILLAGQPELERKLAQPALRQLRQRIALHVRLRTLAPAEVGAYIRSRLERAGAPDVSMFRPDALARIAEVTEGIPRLVNVLCDSCLVAGFATGSQADRPRDRRRGVGRLRRALRAGRAVADGGPGRAEAGRIAPRTDVAGRRTGRRRRGACARGTGAPRSRGRRRPPRRAAGGRPAIRPSRPARRRMGHRRQHARRGLRHVGRRAAAPGAGSLTPRTVEPLAQTWWIIEPCPPFPHHPSKPS